MLAGAEPPKWGCSEMTGAGENDNLLVVEDLHKYFPVRHGVFSRVVGNLKAVDGVSFSVGQGETLGIVGESGCGKTTACRVILRLLEPTKGRVLFRQSNVFELGKSELRKVRRNMQIVFQDPFSSLSPRMTVRDIINEPLHVHGLGRGKESEKRVRELLEIVGLSPSYMHRYPHEFSGGQRQRIGVARALALNPKLIILDEPVSALDVSIQNQIINLLQDLQRQLGLTYVLIAHDLGVIRHISKRVGVMYLGRMVESAPVDELFRAPMHPYTKALLSATLEPDPDLHQERTVLPGDVPSPLNIPPGCRFHPRCPMRMEICSREDVTPLPVGKDHLVACHLHA